MKKKERLSIYSAKQAKLDGSSIYLGADGKEVEVSQVGRAGDETPLATKWDDAIDTGKVTKYIRRWQKGSMVSPFERSLKKRE